MKIVGNHEEIGYRNYNNNRLEREAEACLLLRELGFESLRDPEKVREILGCDFYMLCRPGDVKHNFQLALTLEDGELQLARWGYAERDGDVLAFTDIPVFGNHTIIPPMKDPRSKYGNDVERAMNGYRWFLNMHAPVDIETARVNLRTLKRDGKKREFVALEDKDKVGKAMDFVEKYISERMPIFPGTGIRIVPGHPFDDGGLRGIVEEYLQRPILLCSLRGEEAERLIKWAWKNHYGEEPEEGR